MFEKLLITFPSLSLLSARVVASLLILVVYDMLGISTGKRPSFSKDFLSETNSIEGAFKIYYNAVKQGDFPTSAHSF